MLLVVLSLLFGLVGAVSVSSNRPAAAAPGGLVGRWALDNGSGTTASATTGTKAATLTSGATWGAGVQGASSLVLNGTSGAAVTSGSVLTTSSSFTVSAYVRVNGVTGVQTAVAQDGTQVSGFFLGTRANKFSFNRPGADSVATSRQADSTTTVVAGTWYHIAGVYDSSANTLALYVNGQLESSVAALSGWNATGNFTIGRGKYSGSSTDWVGGGVDDVRAYNRALTADEVSHVSENGHWTFDEGTGTSAADDSQNGYTGTLTNGPAWTSGEIGTNAVDLDGTDDYVSTTNSVVDTSKSFSVSAWARADGGVNNFNAVVSLPGTNASAFYLQLAQNYWLFNRPASDAVSPASYTSAASTSVAQNGVWYHLVGVYDSVAQTLTLYVNGVKQQSVSYTTGWKATGNLTIGRALTGGAQGAYWNGAIDDVRLYSYPLDQGGVTALAGTVPSAPAAPTATAGASSATLTWSAPANGGSAVTGYTVTPSKGGVAQTPLTFDASTTTRTLVGLVPGSSYTFTVAATNPIGSSAASSASNAVTPTSGAGAATLVGRWAFDAGTGTTAADSVGTHPLTLAAGAGWAAGVKGAYAMTANGTATGNAVASGPVLNTAYSFSTSSWVKLSSLSGYQTMLGQDGNQISGFFLQLRADTGTFGFTKLAADNSGAQTVVAYGGTTVVANQWYHLVTVYDSSAGTMSLYQNGRLQQTVTAPAAWSATGSFTVGRGRYGGTNADYTSGSVDDVRAYTGALSAEDVEVLTEEGHWKLDEGTGTSAADHSLNGYTGTLTNGPAWTSGEIGTNAVDLDGTDDYVSTTNSVVDTSKSFSVSAWARADGGVNNFNAVVSLPGTNASAFYLQLAQNYWLFNRPASDAVSPASYTSAASTSVAQNGVWYHLVGVYDSVAQTLTLYVNGVKQQSVSYTTGWKATGNLTIGRALTGGSYGAYWNGAIDDVRLYSYPLDQAGVTALAGTVPVAPSTPTASAGTTSATLSWTAPSSNGGSAVTGYTVTPYKAGVAQTPVTYDASTTTRTLTGLTAGSSYTFTVAAVNPIGTSAASAASNAVTPYDVPGAPTITAATAGDLRATLTWTAPGSTGASAVTGYVVTPYIGATAQTATTFASTATTQTVTGLTAGTAYTFKVAAQNAAGTGAQSAASASVTPNANPTLTFEPPPGGVVGVAYSTQLTVTGGTSPFSWTVSSGTAPAGLSLSTSGLLSGTPTASGSTTFTVRVSDANGQTATRSITLVVTDRPGAVATPTATAGLTSAVVTWTAPASNGGLAITGYVITPSISGVAQTPITVDPSAKTRTLNGLTAGSSYTFTVAAANANGTGTASAASNAVTPYAALNAPTITAVTARTGSATLSWSAPTSTGGSAITGYVVTPYIGTTAQTPQTFTGTATTQTVTGLTPGTAYTFTVAARNASGTTVLNRLVGAGTVTATDGGPDWVDNGSYRSGASSATNFNTIGSLDTTVPSTTPAQVFYTERYGYDTSNEMSYAIPVTSGVPVKVRLYFANHYGGTTTVGSRVFDVALDGTTVLPAFDVIAAAGGDNTGTMREFATTSDGTVNLDFTHSAYSDPVIYGIEIIQTGVTTTGPASSASTAVTPNPYPTLTFTGPPSGEVGVVYSTQLTASGGTSPLTWSVPSGTLPAGLTLSATGLLSGTPTTAGTSTYTVQVTDASGQSDSRSVSTTVAALPSLAFSPAAGEVGVAYSQQPTLTGGTSPYTWSISAGSLPGGLSINTSTGLISGTPTASGTFSVTVRVVDAFNQVATRTASIVIAPLPTLTSAPPRQYQQAGFSFTFTATGGTAPFTYAVVSGSLPSGLSLSSAGVLAGQTNQGSYSFTVRATDAKGQTADDPVTLVVDAPPIQLVKTASSSSVAPGGTVTFTLTATNISSSYYGNTHAYDPLSDVIDDATYDADVTISSGSVSYSGSTLDWSIPLDGGQSATLTYTVTVANPDTGNKLLTGQVDGAFASTSCSSGQRTSACTAAVTVSGLSVATSANVATTTPGDGVTFTAVVTNTGQTPFSAATFSQSLTGILDDATYGGGASATSGTLSYAGSTLTWTGALAAGASATITYSVTVNNPDTGNRSLAVTAVSSTAGSTCASGNPAAACSTTVTVLVPALSISHTSAAATTTPGSAVTYTTTLSNTGQTVYTGISVAVALAAALDDGTYDSATASSGSVTYSSGPKTLTWTGDIGLGDSVTITTTINVSDPDPGDKAVTTVVTSAAPGSTCPVGGSSSACRSTVQVLVPALTFAATANVTSTTPGSVVSYSVVITNTGQTPYAGAAFSTSLTGVMDDATYNGDVAATAGTPSYASSTVSWSGDLAVGASVTVSYSVTVRSPDLGNLSLTSTVVSSTTGSNCPSGSSDTGCSVSVSVLIPALSLSTAVDSGATTTPGTTVRYTFTASNTGQTSYTGAVVSLDLTGTTDDATSLNDTTASTGTLTTQSDQTVRWVLSLAPGQSATVTASYRVNNPTTGNKTLTGNATSSAAGSTCPMATSASSCRTSVSVLIPGVTISVSATPTSVTPGDVVSYTLSIANTGETGYGSLTVTDDLSGVVDDAVYGSDAAAPAGGTVAYSAPVLTWTGALPLGATRTVTFSATVRDPDPGNKQLTSTAVSTAAGSNCASGSTDTRCSTTVGVLVPGLTIAKTAGSATTTPGATVTYTVTVTNSGATSASGATFSDPLTGVLDDADYNGDAAVTSGGGTASYTSSTVSWTGTLAVGASATITYSVTVHAADGGNNRLTSTITSTTRGNNCPSGGSDTRCRTDVPVARLVLTQTATETTATPGSVVHLSTTWTNTGQVPYTGISIASPRADTSDDTTPTGDQVTSSGTLVRTAEAVTWTGDIGVGGVVTGTRTLVVKDPDPGNKVITATLQSSAPGNNCPSGTTDSRCTFSVTVLVPGLTISKVANTTATVPGGTVGYTITAHNTGQTAYTAATLTDSLTGVLDDATYNTNASASSGTVSYTSPNLSWTGSLAVDDTVTITYSVTVKAQPGDKTMVNPVSSTDAGSTCPPATGNASCRSTVAVLTPGLTLVKTADVTNATLGSTVTYTVTATNSGQTSYASAAFTDSLAGVLDDATYEADASATSGTVSYTGSTVSWSGALSPGASARITYSVTIDDPAGGDRSMVNTLVSSNPGNNCATGSSDSRCTATVAVTNAYALTLTKTADVVTTSAGQVVGYTITATNSTGSSIAADFTDPLEGVLDDAELDPDAEASSGDLVQDGSTLSWSGSVGPGATVTVTYSVTVDAVATGDQILANQITSTAPLSSNNCLADSDDPRCASSVPVAALAIEQAYTETTTTPGSLIHLSATFTNTGQADYNGISIAAASADTLDDAIPTGDQVATSGSLVLSATAITWTGNIPVGGSVTVTGTLTVKNPDPGDKQITGTLVSTAPGNNCTPGSGDPRCTALSVVQIPELSITKTADTTVVQPGGQVGYTVTIDNTGETAYTGATVTDALVGVLDDATYDGNVEATDGDVSYASPNLTWTGDLAVGDVVTLTYSVTARTPATGDKSLINRVASTAVGSTCPPNASASACRSSVDVRTPALTIITEADRATADPGDQVLFTVTVHNTGQTDYPAGTQVVLPLAGVTDDAAYAGDVAANSGTVSAGGGTLTWTGALDVDDTVTIAYSATVDDPVPGDHLVTARAQSVAQGSNCPVGGSDPRCVASVPVASLHMSDVTNIAVAQPTDVVRFTETYTNTGQVPFYGLRVVIDGRDVFDDATYNGDATPSSGSLALDPDTGLLVWTGDLGVGASVTTTGSVTVADPTPGNKHLRTRISTSDVPSNCAPTSTDSACLIDVPVLTPGLSVVTTPDTTTTTPGSDVGYTLTVTNTGETSYAGAAVTNDLAGVLDDATLQGSIQASTGTAGLTGTTLSWTGDLDVGDSATISYVVRVRNPDPADLNLVDLATSDELGSTCPTDDPRAGCSSLVTVLIPALDISIVPSTTTSYPGGQVGYTLTIHNSGQAAYTGASVSAALAGVVDDATYGADASADVGTVGYSGSTLTWTGDLGVDETAVVTYSVTVEDPDTGNKSLLTSVSSAAPGSTCTTAEPCTNSVVVQIPSLSVYTTADTSTTTPGSRVTFTVTMTNNGQRPYLGMVTTTSLSDVLDDATFDGSVSASSGVPVYLAPTITWTGNLGVGAQVTITYTVTVKEPDTGDKTMSATVRNSSAGSPCPSGGTSPACVATVQVLVPSLAVAVSSDAATTTPGSVVGYTVLITNDGETPYTGAAVTDTITGLLGEADYDGDAQVSGGGTLAYGSGVLTWTGDLAVGASRTITFSVTVHDPATGDRSLSSVVATDEPGSSCPSGSSASPCVSTIQVLIPALQLTTAADRATVVAGSDVHYTVTLHNTGETAYAPATASLSLTDVLDDGDYVDDAAATTGDVVLDGDALVWSGPLALGDTVTITYSVHTNYPATGNKSLGTTLTSTAPGSTCVTGAEDGCATQTTVLVPALTVTKTASATHVVPRQRVTYTLTATNTGEAPYAAAALADDLGGVLDHATYDADATASRGTVGVTGETLSWTGSLAVGASVVIRYSVVVDEVVDDPDATLVNEVTSTSIGASCPEGTTESACATSTVVDATTLELRDLTSSFTLSGPPGSTVGLEDAVVGTVATNSLGGYSVSVRAVDETLTGQQPGNTDTIPSSSLTVRGNGTGPYTALSTDTSVPVVSQDRASAQGGDAVSTDYQVQIPFVNSDTYAGTVEYVVSAQ